MSSNRLEILLVGDLILGEPEPDRFFDRTRHALQAADLVIGHVEVPHTRRGREHAFDIPSPPGDPEHLGALGRAGFHVATLGGNHVFDHGAEGVIDTSDALAAVGIASCGAGVNLESARRPAMVEAAGGASASSATTASVRASRGPMRARLAAHISA